MRVHGLLDTGAVLALLDRDDEWHDRCVESFDTLRLPLATSAPVLTELFHLLAPHETAAAWKFLRSGAVTTLSIGTDDLHDIEALMEDSRDRPMDFADASLVHLARREGLRTILSVDDDFLIYRIEGRRHFLLYPPR